METEQYESLIRFYNTIAPWIVFLWRLIPPIILFLMKIKIADVLNTKKSERLCNLMVTAILLAVPGLLQNLIYLFAPLFTGEPIVLQYQPVMIVLRAVIEVSTVSGQLLFVYVVLTMAKHYRTFIALKKEKE